MPDSSFARDLVMAAHRLEAIAEKYVFEPMGLTAAGARILKILIADGPHTPSQFLPKTGGTKSNLTQRLNHLEKQDLIRRSMKGVTDKRMVVIEITPAGVKKMTEAKNRLADPTHKLEQMFTAGELSAHRVFLTKLNRILDEHVDQLGQCFKK